MTCAQAAAGEVLVTDTVRGLTRTSGEIGFAARGRKHLKGIAEPVAVYAASAAQERAAAAPTARRNTSSPALRLTDMDRQSAARFSAKAQRPSAGRGADGCSNRASPIPAMSSPGVVRQK